MPPINPRLRPRPVQRVQPPKPKSDENNSKTVAVIVILILLAIGAYFLYPIVKKMLENRSSIEAPIVPAENTSDTTSAPVIETIPEEVPIVEEVQPVQIQDIPQPIPLANLDLSVPSGFYIIVGSFDARRWADMYAKSLQKEVDLEVVYFEEFGVYRVSAGRYDTRREAYNDTYSIKDLDGCTNAWVLEHNVD